MSPRLSRSIPFWILIAGSAASAAGGAYLLVDKLGGMDTRLIDGSATTSDVYVGQIWAVVGAILLGAGLIGLALALTLGALRRLLVAPVAPTATADGADENGYDSGLGYTRTETVVTETTELPAPESEPVSAR